MSNKEELCSVLEDTAELLKKTQVNLKKCPKARLTKGYIQSRIQCIEEYWNTFKKAHVDLVKCTPREQRSVLAYFINEDYYAAEDLYLNMLADLKDILSKYDVVPSDRSSSHGVSIEKQTQVKLPRIELPAFSGSYEDWPTYKDLYTSLVHNNSSLTCVQKLHYLKTSITGEAAALLKHIQITESNYSQAWETLQRRYGNKRLIVNSLLKRLFSQKKCSTQTAPQLKSLLDTTNEILNSLKNLEITTDSWDPLIIFLVVQKLDPESHKEWEEFALSENKEELSKWTDLNTFLESKFRTLELVTPSTIKNTRERVFHLSSESPTPTTDRACVMCKDNHALCRCDKFIKMQPSERSQYIQSNKLCFNCLNPGHAVKRCRNRVSCRKCNRRHHTLLHQPSRDGQSDNHHTFVEDEPSQATEKEPEVAISTHFASEKSTALLATAMVIVTDDTGHTTVLRALVDNGSQGNFISERAAQLLRLKRIPIKGTITGVGSTKTIVEQMVRVNIQSRYDTEFNLTVDAYVMPTRLTSHLPSNTITIQAHAWSHLRGLTLADPSFHSPGRVDMLLGVEVCAQILKSEILKGPPGSPCAQNTSLGWILFGKIQAHSSETEVIVMHHQCDLDDILKKLWEVDTDSKRALTREEEQCEKFYNDTHSRDKTGRYIVKLPFKVVKPQSPEGNTKEGAMRRLFQLERRFKKNEHFKEEYTKTINEYCKLNYMEEVLESETDKPAVYLPHHAVFKESTKIRPVFDASYRGTNNISLNDELLVGPQLQDDVRYLVMRWRRKKIAFTSDIQKMYLQILVSREDTEFQRILWRNDSNDPIKEYRLLRVTFGTASAPFLAVRTLHQLADDEGTDNEAATETIKKEFFMDDLMCSKDTVDEAVDIAKSVSRILRKGGFILQKWASNSSDFLKEFSPDEISSHVNVDLKVDGMIKALGVSWNMGTDEIEYNLNLLDLPEVITKRKILSEVQRLYDPLGWLSAALIPAKLMIQRLWLQKVGWDEEVDPATKDEWLRIRDSLKEVNLIKIKRWLGVTDRNENELTTHGYCDASEKAYGAVAYLRVQGKDGEYKSNIIAAKTKVAPIKALSLPRLELCGAVLLSKLLKQISEAMGIPTSKIFCWTDSTIVLSWLKGDPNRWQTFVRNRVITILDNIGNKWYHIQSQQNPADIASRGILASELKTCKLWWHGPEHLKQKSINMDILIDENIQLERKKNLSAYLNVNEECEEVSITKYFENFKDLNELIRTITYARRFLNHKKIDNSAIDSPITIEEMESSLKGCIKLIQSQIFTEEITDLQEIKRVKNKSKLKTLNPYIDTENILRVGGRIKHSTLDHEQKHPIILDNKNQLTLLLIAEAHQKTLHGGIQLMLNYLRSRYWIIKAKNLVKKFLHKCVVCAKLNAKAQTQLMGELPKVRVTPARPFLHSGVDFAGPYDVLMSKGRGAKTTKSYIAIFVCMVTKAIHLELVGDLTTEAFLGSFRRLVARRGRCSDLWSDQGRNFIGANKELAAAFKAAQLEFGEKIYNNLASEGTQWHLLPAYSPNFAGLWEAGVRSMKYHLKRILTSHLTFEEMTTVLCQVESCLNSRPLYPVDDSDVTNLDVLTPGHFLIGEPLLSIPSPSLKDVSASSLSRWQHTQKLMTNFWSRWQEEYLTRLQQRPKWMTKQTEFDLGQIVLIKTDGLPPGKWHLGRVVEKHPGLDGLTRVYSIKSGNSTVKRSISKLCPIPLRSELVVPNPNSA